MAIFNGKTVKLPEGIWYMPPLRMVILIRNVLEHDEQPMNIFGGQIE